MNSKDTRAALLVAKRADGGVVLGDQRQANLSKFLEGNHPSVPSVLYHGTNLPPTSFLSLSHFGTKQAAQDRLDNINQSEIQDRASIVPVHVSMKNPLDLGEEEDWGGNYETINQVSDALGNLGFKKQSKKLNKMFMESPGYGRPNARWENEAADIIRSTGYDGISYINRKEDPGSRSFISLHPNQVKSAIGNNGNFDPKENWITKATGGAVTDNDNFKSWFGDSVTHTNGTPHVFYTGTSKDKDFNSFNVGRHGAWFTQDPEVASQYADSNDSQGYKRDGWDMVRTNTASRVIPAYIKAEKPYTGELPVDALSDNYKHSQSMWFDKLRAQGYDSWIPASSGGKLAVVLKEPQQIKSVYNSGSFDPKQKHMNKATGGALTGDMPDTPQRNLNSVGLYSKAAELARGLQQPTGTPQQYMAHLAKQGVKPAEFDNAGVPNSPKISREDLASHFERSVPNIGVTRLGVDHERQGNMFDQAQSPFTDEQERRYEYLYNRDGLGQNHPEGPLQGAEIDELNDYQNAFDDFESRSFEDDSGGEDLIVPGSTKYHKYKSEIGGDNYREHLLTLPAKSERIFGTYGDKDYMSSHWDQPNVLAHVRMQDAPRSEDGKKTIHVDEIQSDWAQDGRKNGFKETEVEKKRQEIEDKLQKKGYDLLSSGLGFGDIVNNPEYSALKEEIDNIKNGIVPVGPYVKNTSHWVDLALKHVLHEAAKGDYDKVQFATGGENADRYGLQQKYNEIHWFPNKRVLNTVDRFGKRDIWHLPKSESLHEYIGEELADKLLSSPIIKDEFHTKQSLEGDDLSRGGEGMKSFYDKILPKAAMRLIQQHDPDIKPEKIKGSDGVERFGFSFTPRAKRSIMKGQPAFARGGKVEPSDAQKSAGNYKKKHINFQGLPISIENEKGSIRSGQDEKGNKWSVKMPADYGYVKRTEGADGDHVDVYVGPDESSSNVFVIDQKDHRTGRFDEHKVMLGFDSLRSAIQSYTNGFSDGKAHLRLGNVARLSMKEFKQWLSHHDTKKPIRNQSAIDKALSVAKSAQGAKNGI